jgi:hypothetical protein
VGMGEWWLKNDFVCIVSKKLYSNGPVQNVVLFGFLNLSGVNRKPVAWHNILNTFKTKGLEANFFSIQLLQWFGNNSDFLLMFARQIRSTLTG